MAFRTSFIALAIFGLSGIASAQSTTGNIAGDAKAGDTIIVNGDDNGFKREIKVEKDGKYKLRHVPIGRYRVTFIHQDGKSDTVQGIMIRPDGTSQVSSSGELTNERDRFSTPEAF